MSVLGDPEIAPLRRTLRLLVTPQVERAALEAEVEHLVRSFGGEPEDLVGLANALEQQVPQFGVGRTRLLQWATLLRRRAGVAEPMVKLG